MIIPGIIISLIGFFIYVFGQIRPKLLPESWYSLFFGVQITTIIGLIIFLIGIVVIAWSASKASKNR